MRKNLFYLTFLFAFAFMNAQTVVWSDNFDDEDISDWTLYDEDGDTNNWSAVQIQDDGGNPIGTPLLRSFSWLGTPLMPDNWAVSPAIDLTSAETATLNWQAMAVDAAYDLEKYTVYVGTSPNVADLLTSSTTFTETLGGINTLTDRTLDISAFAGQTVYVAFRHYDTTDQFSMEIDNVSVTAEMTSGGGEDCSQIFTGAPNTGVGIINNGTANYRGASDFAVEANTTFTLEKISIDFLTDGTYTPDLADVYIYENGTGPGALVSSFVGTATDLTPNGTIGAFTRFTLEVTLPTPEVLEGGAAGSNYWVGITIPAPSGSVVAYWVASLHDGNDTGFMYQSADGGATWALMGAGNLEGVMTVSGTCEDVVVDPDLDCGQGDDSNAFENGFQIGTGTDFENADDFMVSANNTLNVQTIELNVLANEPIESISFTFYDDDSGAPGAESQVVTDLVPYDQVLIGSAFGFKVYALYIDVDLNFVGDADGTTYWMQPKAVAAGGAVGAVFWEVSSLGELGSTIHQSTMDGPWAPQEGGVDGVFKLHCDDVTPPPPICFDIAVDVEPITHVVFSDIDNTTDAAVNGTPALEDFTSIEGNVVLGETYDVALEGNTAGNYENFFTVFIDWNQNGDWTDAGEMFEIGSITNSTGTDGMQASGSIAVPMDALEGATKMRVIKNYNVSPTDPCGVYSFGQAEDYTVNVGEASPMTNCDEQEVPSNNLENGLLLQDQQLAVDIAVGDAGYTVYGVDLNVFTDGNTDLSFTVTFYEDEAGLPGAVHAITTASIHNSEFVGNAFGFDVYNYVIDFATDVDLAANTTYWMQVESDGFAWESNTATILGSTVAFMNSNTAGAWAISADQEMVYDLICEELGVSDMSSFDFTYYPNPVKDVLNISAKKAVNNISAYNLAGQQVMSKVNVNNGQVDVTSLTPGVYVFRVTLEGGQVETFKIIKK